MRTCIHCNKELTTRDQEKFCSRSCANSHNNEGVRRRYARQWEDTKVAIESEGVCSEPRRARRYLIETQGHRCSICGLSEWTGQTTPLVLDHINGNAEDNTLGNLRMICPNCDALLPTYKARNKGNGRASRRQRYAEGKSY